MYKFKTTNLRDGNFDAPKITQIFDNYHHALTFLDSFCSTESKNRKCYYEKNFTNQYFPVISFRQEDGKCTFYGRKNEGAPSYNDSIPLWSIEISKNEN